MSSVQFPAPVSRSGVMFGAISPANPNAVKSNPDPSLPVTGARPGVFMSGGAWHEKHAQIPFTRYFPRARRSGVLSNLRSVKGRTFTVVCDEPAGSAVRLARSAFSSERQPRLKASAALRTNTIASFAIGRSSLSGLPEVDRAGTPGGIRNCTTPPELLISCHVFLLALCPLALAQGSAHFMMVV